MHHNYFEIHPCCMLLILIPVYCQVAFHCMDIPHLFMYSHVHGHLGVSSFKYLCSSFNSFRIKLVWTFLYKCFCRHSFNFSVKVLVAQLCPTLCDSTDCSPPGSSVHGILQARILEWVAMPFCRGSSQPRDQTQVSCTAGKFFTVWATSVSGLWLRW